ncbi:MAG: exopolysaccharide synthesis ExoD [Myxococcales bacterium]|nr:exopolysaccharide synthesis ExoD [Myxococcales bacterium]
MDVERASQTIAAEAPRRLRLEELLRELGAAEAVEHPHVDVKHADGEAVHIGQPITVGELVDKAAEGGFGFLIGVLTLIAIPFFGLSTPFGLAIALVGAQLALGMQRPWLPKRARRRKLSMHMLDRVVSLLARRTHWMSKSTKRRWEALLMPRLVGVAVVLLGLGLALPLPVPGSNLIFLIPLFVYAVGLLERDGVWIALGHLGTLVDMALLVVFGATVIVVLEKSFHWLF